MTILDQLEIAVTRASIMLKYWSALKSKRDLLSYEQVNYDTLKSISDSVESGQISTLEARLIIEDVEQLWSSFEEEKKESQTV